MTENKDTTKADPDDSNKDDGKVQKDLGSEDEKVEETSGRKSSLAEDMDIKGAIEKNEHTEDLELEEESEKSANISKDSISSAEMKGSTSKEDVGCGKPVSDIEEVLDEDLDVAIPPDDTLSPSSVPSPPKTSHTKDTVQPQFVESEEESKIVKSNASEPSQSEEKIIKEELGTELNIKPSTESDENVKKEGITTETTALRQDDVKDSEVLDNESGNKVEPVSGVYTKTSSQKIENQNETRELKNQVPEQSAHRVENKHEKGDEELPGKAQHRDSGGGGVTPETLAAKLNQLVGEPEEDLNERLMSEFVQDFGIGKFKENLFKLKRLLL